MDSEQNAGYKKSLKTSAKPVFRDYIGANQLITASIYH